MIWILYVVVGVVATLIVLLGVAAAIGLVLPEAHLAARTAYVARPPDVVWRALTDRAAQPGWRKDLKTIEPLADVDGKPSFREVSRHGTITFVVDEATPPAGGAGRLVTRIADDSLPFGGRWIHQIAADGTGTRITITEDGVVRNPIFRTMSRYVFGHTATIDAFLRDLGAHLGEPVTPAAAAPARA